jgi:hypothetical protein
MTYTEKFIQLQKENEGYVVLANRGNFIVALGRDAIHLNNKIGLKLSCDKNKICKVGFPINSLEK